MTQTLSRIFFSFFAGFLGFLLISAPALAHSQALPDLEMASLRDFEIENTDDGRKLLRFTAIIVNTGEGPFELVGGRESEDDDEMVVFQNVYDFDGDVEMHDTDAVMYFATDGHTHWHVRDLQTYELTKGHSKKVKAGIKGGFCFWDNHPINRSLEHAPDEATYIRNDEMENPSCGREGDTEVKMGLSVGYGDEYPHFLPDQYIDITGLKNGRYRLSATADKANWFRELDEENNTTWVEFNLKGDEINIKKQGPAAEEE